MSLAFFPLFALYLWGADGQNATNATNTTSESSCSGSSCAFDFGLSVLGLPDQIVGAVIVGVSWVLTLIFVGLLCRCNARPSPNDTTVTPQKRTNKEDSD